MNESWETCAVREVKEETNLDITNLKFCFVTVCVCIIENVD